MMPFSEENIQGKVLDHLGIVASTIDRLDLIEKVDSILPLSENKGVNVTMGQRVAAMIFNGLGFIDDRLYLFETFLGNKPLDRLFAGKDVQAKHFNDDALGRCLDCIAEYGVTKFFTEISFAIGREQGLIGKTVRGDTTTLLVYGDYPDEREPSYSGARPKRGFSKEKRHDLKQMILHLATTGSTHFPIWMEAHSGNASDQRTLVEAAKRMEAFKDQLDIKEDFLHVGDSAFYSGVVNERMNFKWISRVPETITAARVLLEREDSTLAWHVLENGYQIQCFEQTYKDIAQRWLLVYSPSAYSREIKTLEKRIEKEKASLKKELWHLGNEQFECEADARKALSKLKSSYHTIESTIRPVKKYAKQGRPKKNDDGVTVFRIDSSLHRDDNRIAPIKRRKGRFILATNQLDSQALEDEAILTEYKALSGTEKGFQFIKDDALEVDSIFLKKPSRINALMAVMALCLMIYGFAQCFLRSSLQSSGETIPSQTGKETSLPSMKWVYRLFHGVQVLTIQKNNFFQELVINLNQLTKRVIRYFGPTAMRIYGMTA